MKYSPTPSPPHPAIRWLALASWVLIALAYLTFFVLDLRLDYTQTLVPCSGAECNYIAVSQAEFDALENMGLSPRFYALMLNGGTVLGVTACWLLALAILWRQGNTRIGWIVSIVLAIIPINMIADADNVAAFYPDLQLPVTILSSVGTIILFGFLYLFPNGRFYPRWAFIPLILSVIVLEVFDLLFSGDLLSPAWVDAILAPMVMVIVFFPGVLQLFRYRRHSTPTERQQTKWLLLGILLLIAGFPVWFTFFGGVVEFTPGQPRLFASLGGWLTNMLFVVALPVTMAIAISRYRLWEIDLVVRRTLQYGLLTGLLALIYFSGVITLQAGFRTLTGQTNSPIITVLSTLAIAALFNPLRRRVQDFIDRRFYRKKYNAELALANFAAIARDEVELDKLTTALLGVVQETMQPESVSLWIKDFDTKTPRR
ncbi:MAG: hypothetical protein HUU38_23875 [Anaerolineales bacterium]|nr:hypothetical protein [Anaerolineales bacterium]